MTGITLRPLRFTDQVEAMTAFATKLGLVARVESVGGGWVELVAGGGGMLALHDAAGTATEQPLGRTGLSFECEDADAVATRVRGAGYDAVVFDEGDARVVSLIAPDGTQVLGDERQADLHGYLEHATVDADPTVRVRARVVTPDPAAYRDWLGVLGLGGVELVEGPVQASALGPDGRRRPAALARLIVTRTLEGNVPGGVLIDPDGEQVLVLPSAPTPNGGTELRIERLDLVAHAAAARALQTAALRTVSDVTGRGAPGDDVHYPAHSARPGFDAVAAWRGDDLIGFAYGHRNASPSWWDDWVRPHLTAAGRQDVLDGSFVIVQLDVDPAWHRKGIGRRLVQALLDGRREPRVLLTTQGGANPARGFYQRLGFVELTDGPRYGDTPFVVLAREPLAG
ncbi:MAG: GNAT family N-acetyltransferase [Pseudorhodobacter sp.]|nr:GNAT family N-acetyltransferase [Frankiaceae bacterium]